MMKQEWPKQDGKETSKWSSEIESLYAKFQSLKDSLAGENDEARFNAFVEIQFPEEEANANKELLSQVRDKIQYYQDLEEVKNLYSNKDQHVDLAWEFFGKKEDYPDLSAFLESKFCHYSDRIKSGYFYKQLVEKVSEEYKNTSPRV